MAKQKGILLLEGKLGGLVFYTNRYGTIARTAGSVNKDRFEKDPAMAARLDAASEFGYAARVSKLLRLAVRQHCRDAESGSTHNRLTGRIVQAVKADPVNGRGQRRLGPEGTVLLKGFNWEKTAPVGAILGRAYELVLDAVSATFRIAGLCPAKDLAAVAGATHAVVTLVLMCIYAEDDKQVATAERSEKIALSDNGAVDIVLCATLPAAANALVVAGIGVQAYQQVNGQMAALQEGCGFEIAAAAVSE